MLLKNKEREVLVAQRNKERTDAVEIERVKKDQELEEIENELKNGNPEFLKRFQLSQS